MSDKKYPYIGRHVEDWNMEDVQAEDFELEQRNMVTKANREITGVDKRDDWPKVGDEVEVKHGSGQVMRGELLAITKEYAIIQQPSFEQHLHLSSWEFSKPKTPGEELLDELSQYLDNSYSNAADIERDKSAFKSFAADLIAKYNITKKEQGNG